MSSTYSIGILTNFYNKYIYIYKVTFNGWIGCDQISHNNIFSVNKSKRRLDLASTSPSVSSPGLIRMNSVSMGSDYGLSQFCGLLLIVECFFLTLHLIRGVRRNKCLWI